MAKKSFTTMISSLSSQTLYLLLILVCVVPLMIPGIKLPTKPEKQTIDLYAFLMQIDPAKPVIIQSDWTNSSKGESAGQYQALLRILMRRNIKFFVISVGDPQAPDVSKAVIQQINSERAKSPTPEREYKLWEDWIDGGYRPDPSGSFATSMKIKFREAFAGIKNRQPNGSEGDIFQSPVLKNAKSLSDFSALINITASGTMDFLIARIGGSIPLGLMCTGVIGPQMQQYYATNQIFGLSIGLKGMYDIEWMMEYGVRGSDVKSTGKEDKRVVSETYRDIDIPPFKGQKNFDTGAKYYVALHTALGLIILCVIAGNASLLKAKFSRGDR